MNNLIRDYIGIEIPIWMQSRKNLFLLFCLDFLLLLLIKTDVFNLDFNPESFTYVVILSMTWCLISYVMGKYSYFNKNDYLIIKIFNLLKSNIISLTLIYLIDKVIIIFLPFLIPFGKNKIILLGLISFLLQFIKLNIYQIINRKKKFYLLGNQEEIESFKNFVKEFPINKNIKLLNFSKGSLKDSEKKVIILLNEEIDNEDIYKYQINLNIEIFTPSQWCEKNLNRIPNIYLKKYEYKKNHWIIDSDDFQWRIKRFCDFVISLFLIIFLSPILLISSILIWIEDHGSIFYRQTRTGLNGKSFKITKLRTMKEKAEEFGPVWASKNDKRITKIGSFLRKTRIDELPQLISVLIGDMSLIGPRPERPEIEITLRKSIPFYDLRNSIKPGLSGWAQVNYPYGASIKDSEIKLSYELFYIRNQSFWFDALIFIKTIKLVLNMKGSKPI